MSTSNQLANSLERLRMKWLARGEGAATAVAPARALPEPTRDTMRKPAWPSEPQMEYIERYPASQAHGNSTVACIERADASPLGITAPPANWAFLDTETTGVSGGSGTYAFLIGVGVWREGAFHVHQFFLRDFVEEPQQLELLTEFLKPYDVLVTYNGKTFDAPLLETRYRMCRQKPALERMQHLDLLHASRRLWKLRLKTCRLVELESSVVGYERHDDVPGMMIPSRYFTYLQTGYMTGLRQVFYHNQMDILSLAVLTSIVLSAVGDPLAQGDMHCRDLYGLATWLAHLGRHDAALEVYARSLNGALPEHIANRARMSAAGIHKRRGNFDAALELWQSAGTRESMGEIAKYYEHRAKDYESALEAARLTGDARRINRLLRKVSS